MLQILVTGMEWYGLSTLKEYQLLNTMALKKIYYVFRHSVHGIIYNVFTSLYVPSSFSVSSMIELVFSSVVLKAESLQLYPVRVRLSR